MLDVLVPLDGSLLAERVLPAAAEIARVNEGQVRLLRAIGLPLAESVIPEINDSEAQARAYLEGVAHNRGIRAGVSTGFGSAASMILSQVDAGGIGYVAMSTHARAGLRRAVPGSVAEHVLRAAPVPVYLLPAEAEQRDFSAIKRIAMAVDGSPLSVAVLEPAALLARQLRAKITLVCVYHSPYGRFDGLQSVGHTVGQELDRLRYETERYAAQLATRLGSYGVHAENATGIDSQPAAGILRLAKMAEADLILMATHGRSGLERLRHGSVTEQVVRHSGLPLLAFGRAALQHLSAPATVLASPEG